MADLFAIMADERRALADDLEKLSDAEWQSPSALKGWKVRHVAGHVVWTLEKGMVGMAKAFFSNGFNLNRTLDAVADAEKRTPQQVAAVLRQHAGNTMTPPGIGAAGILMDFMVHSLDIRRPLGRTHALPKDGAVVSIKRLANPRNAKFFRAPTGFTFVATDLDLSTGTGPRVEGTAEALLLSLTGRRLLLDTLAGDGAAAFREKFHEYG